MAGRAYIPMALSFQPGLDGHFAVRIQYLIRVGQPSADEISRVSFFSGVPYNIIIVNIPQRFQRLYGFSPFEAGLRLVPFNLLVALGVVAATIFAKTRIPPIYLLLIGSTIQLIGLSLFSTLSNDLHVPSVIYGWEVLSGFGIGIVWGILLLIPPQVVEPQDLGTFLAHKQHKVVRSLPFSPTWLLTK